MPDREESVNFATTGNIFIEGENLEVLKVLQKAYFGKIKMIYIDPPYNTGNDNFIYPDKFSESREEYLSRIGDKDETGYLTREGLFRKNSKDSGHYHSNWLSMMYPRLFLARNLLRDDGVIFVSIDDNEVHNLRLLMNEVFGEENFLTSVIRKTKSTTNDAKAGVNIQHEYCLLFAKNVEYVKLEGELKDFSKYKNPDNDPNGMWTISDPTATDDGRRTKNLMEIKNPYTRKIDKPGIGRRWRFNKDGFEKLVREGRILFKKEYKPNERGFILKRYKNELMENKNLVPSLFIGNNFLNQAATKEVYKIFEKKVLDYPKPVLFIKKIIEYSSLKNNDIILDFFSGSATTAHAVFDLNKEDASTSSAQTGNRKFILVQLPEKTDENSEAYKAGYKTIAEIGKERIRRVINKIEEEQKAIPPNLPFKGEEQNRKLDLGFKVFKLEKSNFKIWRTKIETEEQLVEQLQQHLEPLDENAKTEDVLYELLLKSGVPLTAKIEQKEGFYLVNDNEIVLILKKIDEDIIKTVIDKKPQKVITLDRLFKNNDQLKTNTALQMKDAGIEFKVV